MNKMNDSTNINNGLDILVINVFPTYEDEVLDKITHHKTYGSEFIPEIDGKKLLQKILPIEEAMEEGKGSHLYNNVLRTYNHVMKSLIELQTKQTTGGIFVNPQSISTLDDIESMRDRFENGELIPNSGSFGKYYQ